MLLVTGITGHSGRYFLQELIDHKYQGPIRCTVRETSDTSMLDESGLNIEKIVGDLSDEEFINRAMDNVDTIMHIFNIHHSPVIVETAINRGVSRVILVHTTGIYSNFKEASRVYKKVEQKINNLTENELCKLKITILRPSMIYGDLCDRNISKFIKMIDRSRIVPVIDGGKSLIQPVNARDLGKAYYDVLMSPEKTSGKVYDLSGDKPIQIIEVLKLIAKYLKKQRKFINIPIKIGVFSAKAVKLISFGKIDYVEKVQRMTEDRSYSHELATRDFGYDPMEIEKGIQIEVKQYLSLKRNQGW